MIPLYPVAFVKSPRDEPVDDNWADVVSRIELADDVPSESLKGLEAFSHLEVVFYFHHVADEKIQRGVRRPRGNPNWPEIGIFAQRGKNRPNKLGVTVVRLLEVDGRSIVVCGLDAIDGTPVLDLKPVMAEFLPREEVRQPSWSRELMRNYWTSAADRPPRA